MRNSRILKIAIALAGVIVVLGGSKLTSAYFSSSAVARTGVFATAADPKVVVASCRATGTSNEVRFYWSSVDGATKYVVRVGATQPAVMPTQDQSVVIVPPVLNSYESTPYQVKMANGVSEWARVFAYTGGTLISTSNPIEYTKNANDASKLSCTR